jgi:hypothetical protein
MSQSNLLRWIEDADARRFHEAALFDRSLQTSESHYLHLGEVVANLTAWLRHGVSRDTLTTIGCHVLTNHTGPGNGQ